MNETTWYYFINGCENIYTHLKEISTEVQISDYNYKQGPFGNDLNMSVKVSKKKYEIKNDELQLILLKEMKLISLKNLKMYYIDISTFKIMLQTIWEILDIE